MSRSRLALALLSLSTPLLLAQSPPEVPSALATDVVVTAEAAPEPETKLGVAATVIDRAEIERSKKTSVLELLRTVPGLDVVQEGGPGTVTSLFLRGTNSTQALVLVDGVKLNSNFFGGVDFATLSVADVERIEVVRGPFSALYGSEAVGGVVQIFTKRNAHGLDFGGTLAAGSLNAREANAHLSLGEGPISFTAGFRRTTTDGDFPNEFFAATNVAAAADVTSGAFRIGMTFRRDESRTGVPFSGATSTPHRFTTAETTAVSVPVSFALNATTTIEAAATFTRDRPTYSDVDDPYGFTFSKTEAKRAGGRVTLVSTFGSHRVSVGADYERTRVDNEDSFADELDGKTTRTVSAFAEDRVSLLGDKLVATAGVRYDDHSAFGGHTSPRVTLAFRATDALKVRAAAGGAFRSPTVGELYYPFSGNPKLQPERSVSYELGGDYDLASGTTLSLSLFQNDVRDLIVYDFGTMTNLNVGRARMRGVEAAFTLQGSGRWLRASYTYLDAIDKETGLALLRRSKHRASATFGMLFPWNTSAELTGLFVGRRDDVDATTFARSEDASYFRFDLTLNGPKLFEKVSPFLKLTNLFGREYVEVAGFPSPGRRVMGGLAVEF